MVKDMAYKDIKNFRQRLKHRLIYIGGGKCCICGYDKCNTALEFHHLNPDEKEFTLSANANIGTERAINEIKKCILVCANCHREIHEGLIIPPDQSSVIEERVNEILEENQKIKQKQFNYCKTCGKIISNKATYCEEHGKISKRKVKERPSREELKNLIRNISFTEIGKKYEVSDNTIRKWCSTYDLPSKKTEINKYTNKEWELI